MPTSRDLLALLLGASCLLGCRSEGPRPIDPIETEREFRTRSLDDPGLRAWAEPRIAPRPAPQAGRATQTGGGQGAEAGPPSGPATFPRASWDLRALTLAALWFNPALDVARARLEGASGGEVAAAVVPNPALVGGAKHNFDIPGGASPWTWELGLEWPIEFPGKRGYRREEARVLSEAARLDVARAAWDIYRGVRDARLEHLIAARRETEARARATALEACESILRKKLERGAVPRLAVDTAAADASEARLAAIAAVAQTARSRVRLAGALALPSSALEGVRLSSEDLETPPTPVEPRLRGLQSQGLWNRLDVRRLLLEYAAAEAVLQREILGQYPDFRLVPGYEWEEGEKRFIIGASVELPLFDRNQGPILQALARRRELGARFLALQADAIGEIDKARASYSPALQGLDEADRTLASLDAAQRAVATAVELGAEEPLELARSRARVAAARLARVDALESAWTAVSMLEDAVGRPLDSSFFDPPSFDRGDPLVRGDAAGKESVHP